MALIKTLYQRLKNSFSSFQLLETKVYFFKTECSSWHWAAIFMEECLILQVTVYNASPGIATSEAIHLQKAQTSQCHKY